MTTTEKNNHPLRFSKNKVSLFVPLYNEEKIIERCIKIIEKFIKKSSLDYQIFIVNDASQDNSLDVSNRLTSSNPKLSLLNYEIGPTRRENLAQSFCKADGDIVAFVDIDLISSFRFVPDLIQEVLNGYDVVTGSRYVQKAKIKRKPFRLFISILYNFFIRFIFKTRIRDHMCGFKAFKKDVILKLVEEMGYDKSLKRGIFWDTELLVQARRNNYTIKEIPIYWKERKKSSLYFRREVKTLGYIFYFFRKFNLNKKLKKP